MTTSIVLDSRTLAERFQQHAIAVLQSGSTYVLAIGGALVSILLDRWAKMTTDQQTGVLGSFGVHDPGTLTILLTLVTLAVRFKPAPRGTVSPVLQEALEHIAAQQVNARLIAAGQAPLALPAPKLLAVTHEQIAAAQAGAVSPDDDETYPDPSPGFVSPALTAAPAAFVAAAVPPTTVAPQPFVDTQPVSHEAIVKAQLAARRDSLMAVLRECYPDMTDADLRAEVAATAP